MVVNYSLIYQKTYRILYTKYLFCCVLILMKGMLAMVMNSSFNKANAEIVQNSIVLSAALIYLLGLIININELLLGLIQGLLVLVIIIVSIISIIVISVVVISLIISNLIRIKTMIGLSKYSAFSSESGGWCESTKCLC